MRLTTSPPSYADCLEIWEPKPPGTLWATPGLLRDCFSFFLLILTRLLNMLHKSLMHAPSSSLRPLRQDVSQDITAGLYRPSFTP